jgi:2-polyprenyl-6-hydroxyphenyl methylase/3-demethylubiquinone-9 3-methyltransferase
MTFTTVDKKEVEKFSKMAKDWWNPNGKFKPLHLFNPTRIKFIKEKLISHFDLDANSLNPLKKLKILDIGCGGGLLSEPLSRLGAQMTGVDASNNNIEVAKLHSKEMNLDINYICSSPENLNFDYKFDVILYMEKPR